MAAEVNEFETISKLTPESRHVNLIAQVVKVTGLIEDISSVEKLRTA